ncbi:cation-transporting P-type ATPase [Tautonia rosea]|uniref:cation-transporting P-type ATPase n=1 Tax=Tautonia rosea TaxID=2728037 RepID=UPI001473D46A|nr:cation-transporting P-type ATPase [Tautonia rosea]
MDDQHPKTWHHLAANEVVTQWESHAERGLADRLISERRQRYGRNILTPARGQGPLVRFLLQFHQPLVYILLVATIVTLALEEYIEAAVIFGVVLINAVVGFVQEGKALKAIEALGKTLVAEATVIRDGRKVRIDSTEIVPGDLVLLQSGDKVPADLRLLRTRDLQIAEAAFTGESVPVEKASATLPEAVPLADRTNMAYASTLVTFGQGSGVVVATGDHTEVGRISQLMASVEELQTPLTRRIAQFSKILVVIILALAAINFAFGLVRGQEPVYLFMASVALAVAAIPEGLPAAVTIILAIGVGRMAQRRAIIRKLPAVETLGSTTVICSDKTGTLTQNQMTVTSIVAASEHFPVMGVGYDPEGFIQAPVGEQAMLDPSEVVQLSVNDLHRRVTLLECLRAGALCNDSQLVQKEHGWDIQGDPTEGALLVVAAKAGLKPEVLHEENPRVDSIPFESDHQYMATLHDQGLDRPRVVYAKGSVEAILQRCDSAMDAVARPHPLIAEEIHTQVSELAARGLRVLAFARKELAAETSKIEHEDLRSGLTFLGLQAMIDPPRPEALEAIRMCQSAGVRVKMITGDHALTASAIAGQLGLEQGTSSSTASLDLPRAITGQELHQYSEEELIDVADETAVFARVAPEQKLRLVRALQASGHVVAMTGDGVNDAPALKQADIGVAMGKAGTDVARESSDMVLTDDNFASIEAAVEEGRGVFDNLTKFIVWTLPTNGGEGLVIMAAVLLSTKLPISPVQILWVNMTTAIMLGMMLAFEPKERGIMDRPPRDPQSSILNKNLLKRIAFVSLLLLIGAFGLFEWMIEFRGASLAEAQTVTASVFVIGELFYLFNCRSLTRSMFQIGVFSNKAAIGGAIGMLVLQVLFAHAPPMNQLFGTAPLSWGVWLLIVAFGVALYTIVEIEKYLVGYILQGDSFKPIPHHHETPGSDHGRSSSQD